ncbi:hypothetical protein ACQCVK_19220 [Rossellomorea vietnamensis]|uniref:hypothetical protein n=1 Tax=Rossellomorea vietnamensis TaxID=218284 RepID=UPI003CF3F369
MSIIEKMLTSILSSIVLAFIVEPGSAYFSSVIMVSLPVFLLGGTFYSLMVDYILKRMPNLNSFLHYLVSVIFYGAGGLLIVTVLLLLLDTGQETASNSTEFTSLLTISVLPGLLYFHIHLILNAVLSRAGTLFACLIFAAVYVIAAFTISEIAGQAIVTLLSFLLVIGVLLGACREMRVRV